MIRDVNRLGWIKAMEEFEVEYTRRGLNLNESQKCELCRKFQQHCCVKTEKNINTAYNHKLTYPFNRELAKTFKWPH